MWRAGGGSLRITRWMLRIGRVAKPAHRSSGHMTRALLIRLMFSACSTNKIISSQKDMEKFGKMEIQLKGNDILGALKNADLFENPEYKVEALSFISETQAKNGD